jgi:NAD(P)-dependent dehydrogenase (short-subunit alcohol dehydrogenase family)
MSITSAFGYRSTALEVVTGHDLTGKVALVTGASSGLGVETSRALLSAGAQVVMAVRDLEKAQQVADQLRQSTGSNKASLLKLDLGSLESVRTAGAQFLGRHSKLDLLVNNAGVMATPFEHTAEGFEMQFGTNHLGHFLLTNLLLPALKAATRARVVSLSSIGHRRSDIVWDDIGFQTRAYDKWAAYGQSKTANALFAVGLTARHSSDGVFANAVHPGGIQTGLQKHMPEEEMRAMGWIDSEGKANAMFKTPEQGASTSLWAAVGQELEGVGGKYLEDCQEALAFNPEKPSSGVMPYALDLSSAERLWDLSERMVGLK